MMTTATYQKYLLNFKIPGGTSRGVLKQKETYFLILKNEQGYGIGECALFKGLSHDDRPDYEDKLRWLCDHIEEDPEQLLEKLRDFPSIQFGLEQALLSLGAADMFELFPSAFSRGEDEIPINGLIWMGSEDFMMQQIRNKLKEGFTTLKMKIGALDFETELRILNFIRSRFGSHDLELRVDANGAFEAAEALEKLKRLAAYEIHSIEQPVKAGHWKDMARLCDLSPVSVALDEELIGINDAGVKKKLLETIKPPFIILKPSLVGGIKGTLEWIALAEKYNIKWWITSALESNIGLNAIAQFTYTLDNPMPQGLGTGGLFTNNLESPLVVSQGSLRMEKEQKWGDLKLFFNQSY